MNISQFLSARPWIWIVLSFVMMTCALLGTVFIAVTNAPQEVPLDTAPAVLDTHTAQR